MQIRVGYEFIYNFPQPTPMILTVSIHYSDRTTALLIWRVQRRIEERNSQHADPCGLRIYLQLSPTDTDDFNGKYPLFRSDYGPPDLASAATNGGKEFSACRSVWATNLSTTFPNRHR